MQEKTGSLNAAKIPEQAQMFANRLQKKFRHLKKWAQRKNIGAFRLYDRDIPEVPLVLDFYGSCSSPADVSLCGALYKRPYEKDQNDEEEWLAAMKSSAAQTLGINIDRVYFKQRQKQKGVCQYEKISDACVKKTVNEGNLLFKVNLTDYLDTGLFADRRLLREMVRSESKDKKVLNLFSYTGAFSVYAAAGGAASTDSVDLSNTYLNWAAENFSLNGFKAVSQRAQRRNEGMINTHNLIRADVIEFINTAIKEKKRWDIIIVDPPAFSNSKKMTDNFDLNRDLISLLLQCRRLLAEKGKIFVSVNVRRGSPSTQEIQEALCSAAVQVRVTDLSGRVTDEDFKGRKTPKAFLIWES